MSSEKNQKVKSRLHIRNKNRERYDLKALVKAIPELSSYLKPNKHGDTSVDFANPEAVKLLNKALLQHYYGIKNWDIPKNYLCPPIPGRADYIHHIADLLCEFNYGKIPTGEKITCYDIGIGANCIYPLIGSVEYEWSFIGSDIDKKAIESANKIVSSNPQLNSKIECRLQENPKDLFYGVIRKEDRIDLSICNPPFHSSEAEAEAVASRKVKNLTRNKNAKTTLNFGGKSNELWTEGGEHKFINKMIFESKKYASNFYLFSTLVSKQSNLNGMYKLLEKLGANTIDTLPMGTGNKSTRIVAWSFLSKEEQKDWKESRWKKS